MAKLFAIRKSVRCTLLTNLSKTGGSIIKRKEKWQSEDSDIAPQKNPWC